MMMESTPDGETTSTIARQIVERWTFSCKENESQSLHMSSRWAILIGFNLSKSAIADQKFACSY